MCCVVSSPGKGSSLRAAVSTVEGGCAMCSVGGVWGELVCTGMSSDWRLPSTWFWVGVFWRSEQKAVTKCKHKSQGCLKVQRCEHEATLGGRAAARKHTHTLAPAGALTRFGEGYVEVSEARRHVAPSLPGRGNCSKQHPFCGVAATEMMMSAPGRDRAGQPSHGSARRCSKRGQSARPTRKKKQKTNDEAPRIPPAENRGLNRNAKLKKKSTVFLSLH